MGGSLTWARPTCWKYRPSWADPLRYVIHHLGKSYGRFHCVDRHPDCENAHKTSFFCPFHHLRRNQFSDRTEYLNFSLGNGKDYRLHPPHRAKGIIPALLHTVATTRKYLKYKACLLKANP